MTNKGNYSKKTAHFIIRNLGSIHHSEFSLRSTPSRQDNPAENGFVI
jgi:hypothetical protein